MRDIFRRIGASGVAVLYGLWCVLRVHGYAFNEVVPDIRLPANISGGLAWPVRAHQLASAGSISFRWSAALSTLPVTIITQDKSATGRLNEIESAIQQSFSTWTSVSGTTLTANSFSPLTRVVMPNACGSDGINSICPAQPDMVFTLAYSPSLV
jgi:hypothetical protein